MKVRVFLLLAGLFSVLPLSAQTFDDLLQRCGMSFTAPEGMEEPALLENRQMGYEYALRIPGKKFEARWAIRPLDTHIEEYKASLSDSNTIRVDPNKWYRSVMMATVLNISGGEMSEIGDFPPESVKREFGADWGATAFVPVGEEFGPGYDYVMAIAIHKDDQADAYIFFLMSEDLVEEAQVLMQPFFYALKFD